MACNGYNHSRNCHCPFGGMFHGLGLALNRSLWQRKESYTNPNAKCPQCKASVYFYQSPFGGRVFFDAMGPPWPKHPCTDSFNSLANKLEVKGTSTALSPQGGYLSPKLLALESGWFHAFCRTIKTLDTDPQITVFSFGDKDEEKQLFSRIRRDQVDALSPILLKRSSDRKHYEISTLKVTDLEPSELRFTAFISVKDLLSFESSLTLQNEVIPSKKKLPATKAFSLPIPIKKRPKLTIEAVKELNEKKKEIKLAEKKKRSVEELIRRAEKAEKKARERQDYIKNSGIKITQKSKPKLTKSQIREIKKQQQRELQKEHFLKKDQRLLKTSLELAFENAKKNARKLS